MYNVSGLVIYFNRLTINYVSYFKADDDGHLFWYRKVFDF